MLLSNPITVKQTTHGQLAALCHACYGDRYQIKERLLGSSWEYMAAAAHGSDACYLFKNMESDWALVVKGSDDWVDHFDNFRICGRNTFHGQVHPGLYQAALHIGHMASELFRRYNVDINLLTLSGHSRGGSIADILQRVLYGYTFAEVVTFGAPKWAKLLVTKDADPSVRHHYCMKGDPVPYMPIGIGYRRTQLPITLQPQPGTSLLARHRMKTYLDSMK